MNDTRAKQPGAPSDELTTVVFDIWGTLINEYDSIVDDTVAALEPAIGRDRAEAFADAWQDRFGIAIDEIVDGSRPWSRSEDLRRGILADLLTEHGLAATGPEYGALKDVSYRLRTFDGAVEGLDRLASVARVVALTNTDLAPASATSARTGLRWHALISTEIARTLKPRPDAYLLAEDLLGLDPSRSLFVAAHPWDLRAAAEHGFSTAYLPRPHANSDAGEHEFDHHVDSVDDLVAIVTGGR